MKAPHPLLRTIGRTIRTLRRERRWSQEALADLAQIDRSYMSSIERGLRNLSVLNVARIATALRVPLADLLPAHGSIDMAQADAIADARTVPPPVPVVDAEWKPGRFLSIN